ncbi:MAG: SEC-C domain-containing protein [Alphaproteobacteria bacterium]|nr:SEC-C domain-containing protein [Alphaproteobacteria bacterium]MBU0865990.1 SEC-C domain-containing protein [Alphaproteobacteria bacterium]MBU1823777.1 SEC-C domain-containing protein [Alphaproteobacteria bacterium]
MTSSPSRRKRKIGRNERCPCGSGRKFKHCHGTVASNGRAPRLFPKDIEQARTQWQARERVREKQQGLGRPIIAAKVGDEQVVAIGNKLVSSRNWKTFPDFLQDYLKTKLDPAWGNAEIAKPLEQRHTIMQWYEALCHFQRKWVKKAGVPTSTDVVGVLGCYFGLAYGLYLLDHNVELQKRLLARLKDPGNFQGAYYEILVARALISAGFELTLEDETDKREKHCEFAAVSKATGEKFWIEAKMRGVAGLLGRTDADGTRNPSAISSLIPQLNGAFKKPAADRRMIFIDLNCEMRSDVTEDDRPPFLAKATDRVHRYEREELADGQSAYLFITNMTFHRELEGPAQMVALPIGVGIPDFNRSGHMTLYEAYKREQKHADANLVAEGLSSLLSIPSTFDGSLPGVTLHGERPPVMIGQTYSFEGAGEDGGDMIATVTDAIVMEANQTVTIAVHDEANKKAYLLKENMSDAQFADYRNHPDAYFGQVRPVPNVSKTPYEFFCALMRIHSDWPRDNLLERLKLPEAQAANLSDEEVRALYCERLVAGSGAFESQGGVLVPKGSVNRPAQSAVPTEIFRPAARRLRP